MQLVQEGERFLKPRNAFHLHQDIFDVRLCIGGLFVAVSLYGSTIYSSHPTIPESEASLVMSLLQQSNRSTSSNRRRRSHSSSPSPKPVRDHCRKPVGINPCFRISQYKDFLGEVMYIRHGVFISKFFNAGAELVFAFGKAGLGNMLEYLLEVVGQDLWLKGF